MVWKEQEVATLQKNIMAFQMKINNRRKVTKYTLKEYPRIMDTRT